MKNRGSIVGRPLATTGILLAGLLVPILAGGCILKPAKYLSRNACEFLNCEELFFITDLFPLSAQPTGDAGGASGGGEEEEAGH